MSDEMIRKYFVVESKAIDAEAGIYEVMISTEVIDRDGDVVRATGAKIDNYLRNPVVLFGHQYHDTPVAKTTGIEILPGKGIKSRFQFPEFGVSERADTVRRLWAGGFLNAASIGFMPLKDGQKPLNEDSEWGPWEFVSWELLEWSIVPVPANQNALRLALKELESEPISVISGADGKAVGNGQAVALQLEEVEKRGRVLNAANEKRIRDAAALLQEVLSTLPEEPEEEGGDPDLAKSAVPYADQGMADEGESWKGPTLSDFTEGTFADLSDAEKRRIMRHYTWTANNPPETFGDLKLPHHRPIRSGVGPAVWRGVAAAAQRISSSDIPDADLQAVKNHLASHYRQFDKPVPWEQEGASLAPQQDAYSQEETPVVDGSEETSSEEPNTNEPGPEISSAGSGDEPAATNDASETQDDRLIDGISKFLDALKEVQNG